MSKQPIGTHAKFLTLVHVLVDETSKNRPLSKHVITRMCDDMGVYISSRSFDDYLKQMEEAGIVIKHRVIEGKERNAYLYWYDAGWI